jgi:hypothetical protein
MADLFQKDVRTVSEHIRNIFEERDAMTDPRANSVSSSPESGRPPERDAQCATKHSRLGLKR